MTTDTIKFERRIQIIFLFILVASIILGVIAVYSFSRITHTMNRIIYENARNVLSIQSLQINAEKKVSHSRAYLMTSSPYFYQETLEEHNRFIQRLKELRAVKDELFLADIESAEQSHQNSLNKVMTMKMSKVSDVEISEFWLREVRPRHIELERIFASVLKDADNKLQAELRKSRREERVVLAIMLGSMAGAALFGLALFWFITRTVNEIGFLFKGREETEKELRKALKDASDFKNSLDQASIFAMTDANGVITYVNDMFCKISKYSREELISHTHRIVNSGHHPPEFFKDLWGTITQGKMWRGEIKNRAKDGSHYWVDTFIIPFLDNEGRPYQYTAIRNDITYRKEAEEKIKQGQLQLQAIIDNASSVIFLKDLKGRLIFVNRHFEKLLGLQRNEMVGKTLDEILPMGLSRVFEEGDRDLLRKGMPSQFDCKLLVDDSIKTYLTLNFPVKNDKNEIYAIGSMLTDITERQEAEEALKLALKSRDDFISVASHELKTPLSSLKLQSQLLERKIKKGQLELISYEMLQTQAEQTNRHVNRLVRLVDDMLDITRIRSGRLSIHKELTDLSRLVRDVVTRIGPEYNEMQVQLNAEIEEGISGLWDRFRIEQIIQNLLTNALKYGRGKPVSLRLYSSDSLAHLIIADQGRGIAWENQSRIFDRFERAISSNEVSGLGLGLFISKELVKAHQGSIEVHSESEKGAVFKVRLPIFSPEPPLSVNQ